MAAKMQIFTPPICILQIKLNCQQLMDIKGSVHREWMRGKTFPMYHHFLHHQWFFSCCFCCLGWCQLQSSLSFPEEADLCSACLLAALVCDTNSRSSPSPAPVRKQEGLLDKRWLSLSLGSSCKATKAAGSSQCCSWAKGRDHPNSLIYSGCANLIMFSNLKVCHNALQRVLVFLLLQIIKGRKTGKVLLLL